MGVANLQGRWNFDSANAKDSSGAGRDGTAKKLFAPSELSNLSLWLDASDTSTITHTSNAVAQWADKSGNNYHATQETAANKPILNSTGLNGKPAITFDGTNDYFDIDLDFLADVSHSAFVVLKTTGYSNIYGAATSGSGSNSLHVGFSNSSTFRMNYWGNDWTTTVPSSFNSSGFNTLSFIWTKSTNKSLYVNGESCLLYTSPSPRD